MACVSIASLEHRSMRAWTPEAEIAQLRNLSLAELRTFWAERLGKPRQLASTELTRRWLAWELQAEVRGGLDASTRRRLRQLAVALKPDASSSALSDISAKPGTVLSREWSGTTHKVVVLETGFGWNGQTWNSLSEIATKITGTRWSGPRFFGLKQRSDK
jgi:hypothetical protein